MTSETRVRTGDVAPDFTLKDQTGTDVRLKDLLGRKTVVLYFYPKDETPGCTIEARAFRDSYEAFTAAGAEVVGVSADTVASHRRFAQHHDLPFLLLSDRQGVVRKLFGVQHTLGILPGRVTYVIDTSGVVRHIYSSQLRVIQHSRESLEVVRALNAAGAPTTPTTPAPSA